MPGGLLSTSLGPEPSCADRRIYLGPSAGQSGRASLGARAATRRLQFRRRNEVNAARTGELDKPTTAGNMGTVVLSSLAIVLGLFFFVVWLSRRAFPKATAPLSTEVLEIVGRSPLAARHQLQLIRLGRRLLLVSVTPERAETLTELTDPDEVNHLVGLCRQQQAGSITDSFRQVLHQLGSPTKSRTRPRCRRRTRIDQ